MQQQQQQQPQATQATPAAKGLVCNFWKLLQANSSYFFYFFLIQYSRAGSMPMAR